MTTRAERPESQFPLTTTLTPTLTSTTATLQARSFARFFTGMGRVRAEVREDLVSCLRTQGGGSSNGFLLLAGRQRAQVRRFTPREFLRLQGAAELAHSGSATLVRSALGDAVCVDALAWLAERYLNPLLAETIAASGIERSDQDE